MAKENRKKKVEARKKRMPKSGRSVFLLQKLAKERAERKLSGLK